MYMYLHGSHCQTPQDLPTNSSKKPAHHLPPSYVLRQQNAVLHQAIGKRAKLAINCKRGVSLHTLVYRAQRTLDTGNRPTAEYLVGGGILIIDLLLQQSHLALRSTSEDALQITRLLLEETPSETIL